MKYALIAAGQGSRLVSEGVKVPKPLVQVGGTPLLSRLFRIFLDNDAESICIIINEEMSEVRCFFGTTTATTTHTSECDCKIHSRFFP